MVTRPKLNLLVWLLALAVFFVARPVFALETGEWSPALARQLVSEGWELGPGQPPLILFELELVELDKEIVRFVEMGFTAHDSGLEHGEWEVSLDPFLLRYVAGTTVEMRPHTKTSTKARTTTWLGTTLGKEAQILLRQENREQAIVQAYLELRLVPETVDFTESRLKTQIVLNSLRVGGQLTQVQTVVWLNEGAFEPIAVITLRGKGEHSTSPRLFALFITGHVLSSSEYPTDKDQMPVTDVTSFNRLFGELLPQTKEINVLYHRLNFQLEMVQGQVGFSGRYTLTLPEGLGFALQLHGGPYQALVLLLGLYDELPWSKDLKLYGSLLPIEWDFGKFAFAIKPNFELGLMGKKAPWLANFSLGLLSQKALVSASVAYIVNEKTCVEAGVRVHNGLAKMWFGVVVNW